MPSLVVVMIDNKRWQLNWDGSIREGCSLIQRLPGGYDRIRCSKKSLVHSIEFLAGQHQVSFWAKNTIGYAGPDCTTVVGCTFAADFILEAGKRYTATLRVNSVTPRPRITFPGQTVVVTTFSNFWIEVNEESAEDNARK